MAKQGNLLSKTLTIGIIFLFVVMSIIPSVAVETLNEPPTKPIITGPKEGVRWVVYNFTFLSFDPEGSNITYIVIWWETWNDGPDERIYGQYPSGTNITVEYAYEISFSGDILARAEDELGQSSDWAFWRIEIPRNKANTYSLFQLLLNRFPLLEVFLRAINLLR